MRALPGRLRIATRFWPESPELFFSKIIDNKAFVQYLFARTDGVQVGTFQISSEPDWENWIKQSVRVWVSPESLRVGSRENQDRG